jgi:hypothetical protein
LMIAREQERISALRRGQLRKSRRSGEEKERVLSSTFVVHAVLILLTMPVVAHLMFARGNLWVLAKETSPIAKWK